MIAALLVLQVAVTAPASPREIVWEHPDCVPLSTRLARIDPGPAKPGDGAAWFHIVNRRTGRAETLYPDRYRGTCRAKLPLPVAAGDGLAIRSCHFMVVFGWEIPACSPWSDEPAAVLP
jgi:hypothetical protein